LHLNISKDMKKNLNKVQLNPVPSFLSRSVKITGLNHVISKSAKTNE
jgi:hypothetical protein